MTEARLSKERLLDMLRVFRDTPHGDDLQRLIDELLAQREVTDDMHDDGDCIMHGDAVDKAFTALRARFPAATEESEMTAEEALKIILSGVARVVRVSEPDIRAAMRHYFTDCHQPAEGAAALPLAAALLPEERDRNRDVRVGLIHSGGNVDSAVFASVL